MSVPSRLMIGEISSLFGMKVYTDEGRYVGKVDDVVIDVERRQIKSLAVSEVNKALINTRYRGVLIPYRLVKSVGDIIIIKDVFKRRAEKEKE
ncbi:PRC-barrel domain protein [Ferroglobus placidus DSM 10642]|uniref:PRC-barrel domain protein n=2 Tax=Ferroglobus placidus TaxID=54261 RepID=D3S3J2_FERPA|nr:PRC-barrel domain protein [Ferroglobus placidus DSM 10642]